MAQQPLREPLERLHDELEQANAAADQPHQLLGTLQRDTRALLDRADDAPTAEHESLAERLRDAIPEFEASHPTLTLAMMEVVDQISRIGL